MSAIAHVYSDEQLRAAWLVCKLRSWPPSFEEAMADAVHARLVHMQAWRMAHPAQSMDPQAQREQSAAGHAPRHFLTPPPGWVDCKRAAAGDRDD